MCISMRLLCVRVCLPVPLSNKKDSNICALTALIKHAQVQFTCWKCGESRRARSEHLPPPAVTPSPSELPATGVTAVAAEWPPPGAEPASNFPVTEGGLATRSQVPT